MLHKTVIKERNITGVGKLPGSRPSPAMPTARAARSGQPAPVFHWPTITVLQPCVPVIMSACQREHSGKRWDGMSAYMVGHCTSESKQSCNWTSSYLLHSQIRQSYSPKQLLNTKLHPWEVHAKTNSIWNIILQRKLSLLQDEREVQCNFVSRKIAENKQPTQKLFSEFSSLPQHLIHLPAFKEMSMLMAFTKHLKP